MTPPKMALRCITRAQWNLVPTQDGASLYYTCAMEFSYPHLIAIALYFTHARDNRISPMRAEARYNHISLQRATARENCVSPRAAKRYYDGTSLYYTCAMEFSNPSKMALRCITRARMEFSNTPKMALRCITRAQWNSVTHPYSNCAVFHSFERQSHLA